MKICRIARNYEELKRIQNNDIEKAILLEQDYFFDLIANPELKYTSAGSTYKDVIVLETNVKKDF